MAHDPAGPGPARPDRGGASRRAAAAGTGLARRAAGRCRVPRPALARPPCGDHRSPAAAAAVRRPPRAHRAQRDQPRAPAGLVRDPADPCAAQAARLAARGRSDAGGDAVMMTMEAVPLTAVVARDRPPLSGVLARPGTRAVLLAGSRDPNAKVTLVLLDGYGAAFVVKVPTTAEAARVVQDEAELLEAVRRLPIGRLAELQTRTAGPRERVAILDDALDRIGSRFPDNPDLPRLRHRLVIAADRLSRCATPRTVVHGDYWYGNLLVARERRAVRVVGVVDWE